MDLPSCMRRGQSEPGYPATCRCDHDEFDQTSPLQFGRGRVIRQCGAAGVATGPVNGRPGCNVLIMGPRALAMASDDTGARRGVGSAAGLGRRLSGLVDCQGQFAGREPLREPAGSVRFDPAEAKQRPKRVRAKP